MFSRTDRSIVGQWWWTVDRGLLAAIILLMIAGIMFSFAASPPVAVRLGLSEYHFVLRQAFFAVPALLIMFGTSLLNERQIRRAGFVVFMAALALMLMALATGPVVKGASRWISLGGFSLQPSEFAKPAFIVLAAWLFAERAARPDMPANLLVFGLYGLLVTLLVLQPDFGQTALITLVWGAMFFIAGLPWLLTGLIAGLGVAGMGLAYLFVPHVTKRIDRFLNPGSGDTFQVDTALSAFSRGGWLGTGPGEGRVKNILPDAHTDFIFAVIAEEFGAIICLVLIVLLAYVVWRGFRHAWSEDSAFARYAVAGLVVMFGLQAGINLGVNVSLLPAKGMTLPFISYGGSSTLSMGFAMGIVLALTRRWPGRRAQGGQARREKTATAGAGTTGKELAA